MAVLSASDRELQRDALGTLDAIKSITEELSKGSVGDISDISNINVQLSTNPLSLLLKILQKFVTYDEIVNWLSRWIVYEVPVIELVIKGVLLSNLKKTIDCTNDPRIPEKYRAYLNDTLHDETNPYVERYKRGFNISLGDIDLRNMLYYSPFSKEGRTKYFGTEVSYKIPKITKKKKEIQVDFNDLDTVYSYKDALQACKSAGLDESYIQKFSEVNNVYELARANDFNAFLWFVKNNSRFPMVADCDITKGYTSDVLMGYDEGEYFKSSLSPFSVRATEKVDAMNGVRKRFKDGYCVQDKYYYEDGKYYSGSLVSLCIRNEEIYEDSRDFGELLEPFNCEYTFLPFSMDNMSANWYVNRKRYFDFLYDSFKKDGSGIRRDYDEEFAICNLSMNRNASLRTTSNFLNLQILPKPCRVRPFKNSLIPFNPLIFTKRILFDRNGKPALNGNYTVKLDFENVIKVVEVEERVDTYVDDNGETIEKTYRKVSKSRKLLYPLCDINGTVSGDYYLEMNMRGKYRLVKKTTNNVTNRYSATTACVRCNKEENSDMENVYVEVDEGGLEFGDLKFNQEISCFLFECYKGFTIYEFNYDLVMGMRLFDAKTLTANLIDALIGGLGGSVALNLGLNKTEIAYKQRLSEIINKMLEENTSEVADCFFSFSNEEFNKQLEESEIKRSNLYPFNDNESKAAKVSVDDIYNTLNEYSDSNDKETNVEILTRAFNQATVSITDEVMPSDKYNIRFNAAINLIKMLAFIIVDALLTPKVMLLFRINRELMGDIREKANLEDILKSFLSVILAIVREIVEMILQYLLEWVVSILKDIFELLAKYVVVEQVRFYRNLIKILIKNCLPRFGKRKNLQTTLDRVYYADIDQVNEIKTDEC